jgi:hypothetical protein
VDGLEGTAITRFKPRWRSWLAVCSVLLGVIASLTWYMRPGPAERPSEVVEIPGPTFTVRISSYPEKNGGFVAGAYYRFESRSSDRKDWLTVMQFRHDDPDPIPRQNVRFLNSDVAFLFMGWKYAVTTNGGKHWRVWNAEKDLAGWQCCNYGLIKEVELSQNGNGKMIMNPISGRRGEVAELFTSDFGDHWNTSR